MTGLIKRAMLANAKIAESLARDLREDGQDDDAKVAEKYAADLRKRAAKRR